MKEINKIYLSQFFSGFAMIAAFTPLYFLSNGITQSQLGILIGANILTLALFDIPTGAIADTFGHKTSVFLGTLIWSISYLILFFAKGFPMFLLCMIIGGLGLSLVSGALTSLIYDILDKQGRRDDFRKVYGRCNGIFLVASVVAASIGGFIYQYQPNLIFLIAFIFTFIGAISILFVSWNFVGNKPSMPIYLGKIKNGFLVTISNKSLLSLIVMSIGLSFGIYVINNIKQPFLVNKGFTVAQVGIILGLISGVTALFYTYGHSILKRFGDFKSLIVIAIIAALSLFLISFSGPLIVVAFLIIYQLIRALSDQAVTHLQQQQIADDKRATVNSTMSFFTIVIIAIALPLWGIVVDHIGINTSLVYLGLLTSIVTFLGFLFYRKSLRKINKDISI